MPLEDFFKPKSKRGFMYNIKDNLIGYDDGRDTPGERLGMALNKIAKNPVQTILNAGKATVDDLNYLMFQGGAEREPERVFGYAAAPMAPGALRGRVANVVSSGGTKPKKGITAYHGSPHDFDRFSMDKIGTGEGAQAYGHGLYFAENEAVARGYRDALSLDAGFTYKGRAGLTRDQLAEAIESDFGRSYLDNVSTPRGVADGVMDELIYGATDRKLGPERSALRDELRKAIGRTDPGSMYEVRINADPDDFLDWDAPLRDQPKIANRLGYSDMPEDAINAEALRIMEAQPNGAWLNDPVSKARIDELQDMLDRIVPDMSGQEVYRGADMDSPGGIVSQLTNSGFEDSAERLRKAGIPGIKYRDAGSRGLDGQSGTRNFVVFDENLIEIVRKYGIAGAAAMLGISAQELQAQVGEQ